MIIDHRQFHPRSQCLSSEHSYDPRMKDPGNEVEIIRQRSISKNVVGGNGDWQLSNGNCTTERNCGFIFGMQKQ